MSDKVAAEQSQAQPKPVFVYGWKLLPLLVKSITRYKLAEKEAALLGAFLLRLTQEKTLVNLRQDRFDSNAIWFDLVPCTNLEYISTIFKKLIKKGIFSEKVRKGGKTYRFLSDQFLMFVDESHFNCWQGPVMMAIVDNVDNLTPDLHADEGGTFTPVKVEPSREQRSDLHANEGGSIIEELSYPELSSPPFKQQVSSPAETVDNSDNSRQIEMLSKFLKNGSVENGQDMYVKLHKSFDGSEEEKRKRISIFVSYCVIKGVSNLNPNKVVNEWVIFNRDFEKLAARNGHRWI